MDEALWVPEGKLSEVIKIIRAGLKKVKVSRETKRNLKKWCDEYEEYLKRLEE